jgi:hypothetical protein
LIHRLESRVAAPTLIGSTSARFTPAIPPIEIQNLYASARYKIFGEGLQFYGDISTVTRNRTTVWLRRHSTSRRSGEPQPVQSVLHRPGRWTPTADNATTQLRSISIVSVQELGNRRSFYDFEYYRYIVGFNGNFDIKDNQFISNFGYDTG